MRGDSHAVSLLRTLRDRVFERGMPDAAVLAQCLDVLRTADLRASLPSIVAPTLVVAGQHDRLCPPAASRYLATRIPDSRLHVIARASHAPFLSHRQEFQDLLQGFLAASSAGAA